MNKITTYKFDEPFLDNLVQDILRQFPDGAKDLSRLCLVFGGKRPALFIKRKLARVFESEYIPPRFFTIDEFMAYIVTKKESFARPGDLDHCYLLYRLAEEKTPDILRGREKFAEFLPWVREILGFINHLDLENIPDEKLKAIESNAEIGYAVPTDINRLLEHVVVLRQAYHQAMRAQGVYARGFQYLRAADLVASANFDEFDRILFANFFYFNRCEEVVVKDLYERDKAILIFQGDQRKWPVLKRIADIFDTHLYETDAQSPPPAPDFQLHLYAGRDGHAQVGLARRVLKNISVKENTVIVLPEYQHLVPLLSVISQETPEYNVSMGYPLKRGSLYALFEAIARAQATRKREGYYAKDYLSALRHPFIKNLNVFGAPAISRGLIHKIEEILTGRESSALSGSSFIHLSDLAASNDLYAAAREMLERTGLNVQQEEMQKGLKKIQALLFTQWEEVRDFNQFAQALGCLLDTLVEKSFMQKYPLNINIASAMYRIRDELAGATFSQEFFPFEEMFRIFDSKVTQEKTAFTGSPLKGLQVLGLAETRSLNFEHVIILDTNEGLLPRLRIHEALIPREVMISLGLDRLEMEEEIQRYQFMRLISAAKQVHLIYEENKEKERSRFIEELVWEAQKKRKELETVPVTRGCFDVKIKSRRQEIKKTPAMIAFLKEHVFSASSLNMYLRDPMEFYTTYVLGLREQDDLLDDPEARHVGTFIHEILEKSFEPYVGQRPVINDKLINRLLRLFDQRFDETFARSMKSDAFLLKSVLLERLKRFLENEQNNPARAVKELIAVEKKFNGLIPLTVGDIRFRYVVDRIDRMPDGSLMVIDYKTGITDVMPRDFETMLTMSLSRESVRDRMKSFQLPLYLYFLEQEFPGEKINAGLYSLRTIDFKPFYTEKTKGSREKVRDAFLRTLDFIITEILNPDIPFVEEK